MPDHGTDMQTVIGNLAAKLREHPDDAEGWALLGRTYKATEHYTEARDAFRHALEAAPGDAALEREYAAMAVAPAADNAVATRGLLPVR
jgi:cytochrome c-type biogenesis protein CcmH